MGGGMTIEIILKYFVLHTIIIFFKNFNVYFKVIII